MKLYPRQTDMAIALNQLRALESHQAQKKKQEEASRRLAAAKDEANRSVVQYLDEMVQTNEFSGA